jgi:hypothetical protein
MRDHHEEHSGWWVVAGIGMLVSAWLFVWAVYLLWPWR